MQLSSQSPETTAALAPSEPPIDRPSRWRRPSSLYQAHWWRQGLKLSRRLPRANAHQLARGLAAAYWVLRPTRREIATRNLLPALDNDAAAARGMARALFRNFALKLADLWRYEAGLPVDDLFQELNGWDYFLQAHQANQGVLLLTPHLGNWEFGGPLLTGRGYKLQVITLAEPGKGLTELRQVSRARWGIDTLVIGEDPFAFVEVIRQLKSGATVALLMDRPPAPSAVTVQLFGRPFAASIAAAELARASGCALLPVFLPRTGNGYSAHVLPPVPYERRDLGNRPARLALTQEIVDRLAPAIRAHLDQWYHFVPVWDRPTNSRTEQALPAGKRES